MRDDVRATLRRFCQWWPPYTLTNECRHLIHAAQTTPCKGGGSSLSYASSSSCGAALWWAERALRILLVHPNNEAESDGESHPDTFCVDWAAVFDVPFAEGVHLLGSPLVVAPARYRGSGTHFCGLVPRPAVAHMLVEAALDALHLLFRCTKLLTRLVWLLDRPGVSLDAEQKRQKWRQMGRARAAGGVRVDCGVSSLFHHFWKTTHKDRIAFDVMESVQLLSFSEWVTWELSSFDAAISDPALDLYTCRTALRPILYSKEPFLVPPSGLASSSAATTCAVLAENILMCVIQWMACSTGVVDAGGPRHFEGCVSGVLVEARAAAGGSAFSLRGLGSGLAARARLLRLASQLAVKAEEAVRQVVEKQRVAQEADWVACWVLRALLHVSAPVERAERAASVGVLSKELRSMTADGVAQTASKGVAEKGAETDTEAGARADAPAELKAEVAAEPEADLNMFGKARPTADSELGVAAGGEESLVGQNNAGTSAPSSFGKAEYCQSGFRKRERDGVDEGKRMHGSKRTLKEEGPLTLAPRCAAAANEPWRRLSVAALECVETISLERLAPPGMGLSTTKLLIRLVASPLLLDSPSLLAELLLALAHRHSARHSNCIPRNVLGGVPEFLAPTPEPEGSLLSSVANTLRVAAASTQDPASGSLLPCVTSELRLRACVRSRRLLGITEGLLSHSV